MKKDTQVIVDDVKKRIKRNGDFTTDIKEYGLTVDDVSIVHLDNDPAKAPKWRTLQKGTEPRVRIIVEMVRGKLQATGLQITTLINGKRVGRPPMKRIAA